MITQTVIVTILASCIVLSDSFSNIGVSVVASHDSSGLLPSISDGRKRISSYERSTVTRIHSAPPRRRQEDENRDNIYEDDNDRILKHFNSKNKSEESSFWYGIKIKSHPRQEDVVPYQPKLDSSGPLPFGSYRMLGREEFEPKPTCLMSVAFDFWNTYSNNQNIIDTSSVLQNTHRLIDSGFTSFQLYNEHHQTRTPKKAQMQPSFKQTFVEQNIYHKIVQETPSSVLNQCSFSTRINIPPLIPDGSYQSNYHDNNGFPFIFKESLVRQNIGQSIKNIYGQSNGCIDAVQVNYQHDGKANMSPYTFDVLSVLFDMQREGLISSISGLNFPMNAIDELERTGFSLDYNQFTCNLLDPSKYVDYKQRTKNNIGHNNKRTMLSSSLAGGLLTNRYSKIPYTLLHRNGVPMDKYMSPSENWHYKHSLVDLWIPNQIKENNKGLSWHIFQNEMMKVLEDIAFKHQVSIASIALRWSIQLDEVGSVVVGSSLNAHFDDNDRPYSRHDDLREVFSFYLDEEDMDRLWDLCGGNKFDGLNDYDNEIDFGNQKLWL